MIAGDSIFYVWFWSYQRYRFVIREKNVCYLSVYCLRLLSNEQPFTEQSVYRQKPARCKASWDVGMNGKNIKKYSKFKTYFYNHLARYTLKFCRSMTLINRFFTFFLGDVDVIRP